MAILQREVLALVANGCGRVMVEEAAPVSCAETAEDVVTIFSACPDSVRRELVIRGGSSAQPGHADMVTTLERAGIVVVI